MTIFKFAYRMWPNLIRAITNNIQEHRVKGRCSYTIEQAVFCGLMVFVLRYRSLRSFCFENKNNPRSLKNFQKWITISDVPSDDELRYILQCVSTRSLNNLLKEYHQRIERNKILYQQKIFGKYESISVDGTGQLSSSKLKGEKYLTKKNTTGGTTYYHGQLLASLTNTSANYALPLQFEPIEKNESSTEYSKNDCELNAGKRLFENLKKQFPKRSFLILADNLFGVDPIVNQILNFGWSFVITAKPERNKELFLMYDYIHEKQQNYEYKNSDGVICKFKWSNKLPLKYYPKNENEILVNLLFYEEINSEGEVIFCSSWMTNLEITSDNVKKLAQVGRARFVIENRNFNEQKKLGFGTEHNFGHRENLPNVFFGLAQVAQLITEMFRFWRTGKAEINKIGSKRRYFERLAVQISSYEILDSGNGFPIFYLKFDFDSA